MSDFLFLNRCAVVVTPNEPFCDWVKKTGELVDSLWTQVRKYSNVYLVPDFESEEDIKQAIERHLVQNYEDIFVHELEEWFTDPATFPETTYQRFKEWFTVRSHAMIFDTVDTRLKRE